MSSPPISNAPTDMLLLNSIEHAHMEWMAALDIVSDPIFLHDKEFRILRCNKAYQQRAGIPFCELIGQPYYDVFPKTHEPIPCCLRSMGNANKEDENEELSVGESIYRVRAFSVSDVQGAYHHSVHILEDITERKRMEKELRESEARYRRITEEITDYQYTVRIENGCAVETIQSPACETVTGYTAKEFSADPYLWIQMVAPEDRDLVREKVRQILAGKDVAPIEHRIIRKDGDIRWVSDTTIPFRDISGNLVSYIGVLKDITERKQAEAAIQDANRALATLSQVNHTLVHISDEEALLRAICHAIVEHRGYRMAWVGYVQHDENKSIKIMARAGFDEGYLDGLPLTWAEAEHGMGPCGCAIRSGATQFCRDIASDLHRQPWRDAKLKRGYASYIALPLIDEDMAVFGTLTIYSGEVNAFSTAEVSLLEELAGDLAFGVRSLHVRRERDLALEQNRQQLGQLQNSLEDTVRAIASIVEMRDPYTSGHQSRVADLAGAIAKQMGLPDEQAHAIHLAGVVHDLGKIMVPSEILSKPGRISDIEFSLIKVHPQAGFDILKGISFPWPIAQMVLQHHERMDGSGYPQGLRGDAILLEARVIGVADVVEAMSSHRPYRPGLGIEAALEEIERYKGTYYDAAVVEACSKLFRQQGFNFST